MRTNKYKIETSLTEIRSVICRICFFIKSKMISLPSKLMRIEGGSLTAFMQLSWTRLRSNCICYFPRQIAQIVNTWQFFQSKVRTAVYLSQIYLSCRNASSIMIEQKRKVKSRQYCRFFESLVICRLIHVRFGQWRYKCAQKTFDGI